MRVRINTTGHYLTTAGVELFVALQVLTDCCNPTIFDQYICVVT